ncbi:glycosyltransferase [Nocardioides iriomotensis]|uniref:Glycosyltransferase n=1 Tax=Nocardioides iriomotensis TaxID=715784 RepID=A0A4Q5J7J0_9ACTN|nr:glycosyltransferase [Nocardioides iriomotensis]
MDEEVTALSESGVDVHMLERNSDDLTRMRVALAAAGPVYSHSSVRELRSQLKRVRPDVMHVHNVFPLLSPWIVRVATEAGVPVIQTVHNFRHSCVKGTHFRDDRACMDCVGRRLPLPALTHGCYRESAVQTLPMALGAVAHHGSWRRVSRFLAVSQFVRDHLCAIGFPDERVYIKPNGVRDAGHAGKLGDHVLFAGRLSEEKGLSQLLNAWQRLRRPPSTRLLIAGHGPLVDQVAAVASRDPSVEYLGSLTTVELAEARERARLVVVPSLGPETFGRVVAEAFAGGRPVVVSDRGALPELVDPDVGEVWRVDSEPLEGALERALQSDLDARGHSARARFVTRYGEQQSVRTLIQHYQELTQR